MDKTLSNVSQILRMFFCNSNFKSSEMNLHFMSKGFSFDYHNDIERTRIGFFRHGIPYLKKAWVDCVLAQAI